MRRLPTNKFVSARKIECTKILSENKIYTWVFVAPLLPYITDSDEEIEGLIKSAEESGAQNITFDSLNPYPKVWHNVITKVRERFPEKLKDYDFYYHNKIIYEKKIKDRILNIGRSFKIKIDFAF
ncbi:MAG: hypothetical protein ABIL44_12365 [candidate division WOR-3 bacterium]